MLSPLPGFHAGAQRLTQNSPTSVVTLSVWRVAETIYYKTGYYPTRDPTWYGPKSILLIVLEVNIASICASVPIFWPVLAPYLGSIFVTREFSIKTETVEWKPGQQRSDSSSGSSSGGGGGGRADLEAHYQDPYVRDLVDPFAGGQASTVVESNTRSTSR